jgi:membrane-associated phospholipid phosphatase
MSRHKSEASKKVKAATIDLLWKNRFQLSICLTFLAAFVAILLFKTSFMNLDMSVNAWAISIQLPLATTIAIGIADIFDTYSLLVATVAIAGYLFYKNFRLESLLLLGAMGGDAILVGGFKYLIQSLRPPNGLVVDSGYSFPSGHTVGSIVFCGLLAFFAWKHWKATKPRTLIITLTVAATSVVGFDRIYLNVHWFSDVFGGCMLGLFWLTFAIIVYKLLSARVNQQPNRFNLMGKVLF